MPPPNNTLLQGVSGNVEKSGEKICGPSDEQK